MSCNKDYQKKLYDLNLTGQGLCAPCFLRKQITNENFFRAELFFKFTNIALLIHFESSSYSLSTKNIWFKTVFKDPDAH